MYNAVVTIQVRINNVISDEELSNYYGDARPETFENALRDLIQDAHLFNLIEDELLILDIQKEVVDDD